MSKRCQNVKKMSNVKKSNTQTIGEVHKKKNWHNEVNTYWCQFWCQIWRSPKLFKNTFHAHFESFWSPSYVMSKLTSICVNLIMWIYFFLWTSSIVNVFDFLTFDIFLTTWHLFDNLTSFWQLDIFFDIWAMGNVGKWVSWLILKIEMGHLGGWGTWPMGHMANGAHGQWDTWAMGHGQRSIMVNIKDRHGAPWGMGHMGDGACGQWGTWPMEHMGIT